MTLSFDVGLVELGMKSLVGTTRKKAAAALQLAAEHILTESNKHVPHRDGTLERSGATSIDAEGLVAAVSYNTPYAKRQHEELTWRHEEGRTAKYLENAINSEREAAARIVARTLGFE